MTRVQTCALPIYTFGKVLLPQAAGVLVYVLMALILLWRPDGLFKAG